MTSPRFLLAGCHNIRWTDVVEAQRAIADDWGEGYQRFIGEPR
jgi:hypothetical protein